MRSSRIKVSIVGTNGIPAQYGGYETLTEYLTEYLSAEFDFIVYCSKTQKKHIKEYNGAQLKYILLNANGWQGILYDILTLFHAALKADVILYLGPGAGFIVPFLKIFKKKIITNHGGLNEWEREKYSAFQRFIAKLGHNYAAKYSAYNIADNCLLKDSIKKTFGIEALVIRYGGDHAIKMGINQELYNKYPFLIEDYYVNVSRAQIDNNLHLVLEAFTRTPNKKLVMVSNWSISDYGKNLKIKFKDKFSNIILLDAIYSPKELNAIRGNAKVYIHSHSYCGTAPSLVEAMSFGLPVFSFNVGTNRETTQEKAHYFENEEDLINLVNSVSDEDLILNGLEMHKIASREYSWSSVSSKYAELFRK